jgi:hypothetical protein
MRGGRSLLVLLVIALGLGAYIYFVERERDPAADTAKENAFTGVTPSDITELTIRSASGETTTLRRSGDNWTVASPVEAPADSATVESILSSLSTLTIDRVVDDAPAALDQYGLDTPRVDVSFATADGTHRLLLGNTTPTSSGVYARIDDNPRLVLIASYLESTFDRTTFDLRDRRVLDVARDTVERISIAPRSGPAIELRRDGVNWRLSAPIEARADFSPADGLLSRLTTAQMRSIVKEGDVPTPAELRSWGLDTPQLTATVTTGSSTATIALGREHDAMSVYARDLARPMIFTVDSSLLTDLRKDPGDLRVRDVFEFNAFSASSLELTRNGTTHAWTKSTPDSGADASDPPTWRRTQPDAGDVNQTTMTDLLNALSALRAERFVAQVPTGGDTLGVVVRSGTGDAAREERVTLRRSGDTVHVVRDGEPGSAVVATSDYDAVIGHLNTLTAAPAEPAAPAAE